MNTSLRSIPQLSLVFFIRMNRMHISNLPNSPKPCMEEEPEVWKYLGDAVKCREDTVKCREDKRKKRLENARKFLKCKQAKGSAIVKMKKNTFFVSDCDTSVPLEDIELPPPVPQEIESAPPLPSCSNAPPPPPPTLSTPSHPTESTHIDRFTETNMCSSHIMMKSDHVRVEQSENYFQFTQSTSYRETGPKGGKPLNRLQAARPWEHLIRDPDQRYERGVRVRLLSYNVLAQNLLNSNPQLYRNCALCYLRWENRWKGIQLEVMEIQPDIICFQEVQFKKPNYFKTHYLPFFESLGYRAVFKSRTGDKQDGCAIFYKILQFKLEEYSLVEYLRRDIPLLDRDNVGIVCRLRPRGRSDLPALVVGTTHLLFNKKRTDIRLAQISVFLAELDRLSFQNGKYSPAIITGDFNSTVSSEVYKLVSQGEMKYEGLPTGRRVMPRQLVPVEAGLTDTCQWERVLKARREAACYGTGSFSHKFSFSSVYGEYEQLETDDRVVSTNHGEWVMVDFIFYTPESSSGPLRLVSRLLLPRYGDMQRIGRIPSDVCPSDHFPLVADFLLLPHRSR